jgi:hypothetical protein
MNEGGRGNEGEEKIKWFLDFSMERREERRGWGEGYVAFIVRYGVALVYV